MHSGSQGRSDSHTSRRLRRICRPPIVGLGMKRSSQEGVEKEIVSVRSYLFKNSETYYWFDECRGILIV